LAILGLMGLLWLASLVLHNSSLVDLFWGLSFVWIAWLAYTLAPVPPGGAELRLLMALVVTIWGLRLSAHLFLRNLGKPEDYRYTAWRARHGGNWWWVSLLQVFLLQGLLLWLISIPVVAVMVLPATVDLPPVGLLGLCLWGIGFFFEAVGDWQLGRFKADPARRSGLMMTGLWSLTRHPNYFGDAAQWWGFFLLAASAGFWWSVFSPLLMTVLLVRVSGAALLERRLMEKPGYAEYARRTSAFLPWFPRGR
jgi:steroid 5-alpha reductase family enzyme